MHVARADISGLGLWGSYIEFATMNRTVNDVPPSVGHTTHSDKNRQGLLYTQ